MRVPLPGALGGGSNEEAIDAPGLGAVIKVDAATSSENIVISEPDRTLRGAGGRTILDGSGRSREWNEPWSTS